MKRLGADQVRSELVTVDRDRSRVEFLGKNGQTNQILIEMAGERYQFAPKAKEVHKSTKRIEAGLLSRPLLKKGAKRQLFTLVPGGIVAGRNTQLLSLTNLKGVVIQRNWIDPESGVILKREISSPMGVYLGGFEFNEINYAPNLDASTFDPTFGGAKVVTLEEIAARNARKLGLRPLLFNGTAYSLESSKVVKSPMGASFLSYLFNGSKGKFSLIQIRGPLDESKVRQFAQGYSVYQFTAGAETIAIVGDMPEAALKDIAGNLSFGVVR